MIDKFDIWWVAALTLFSVYLLIYVVWFFSGGKDWERRAARILNVFDLFLLGCLIFALAFYYSHIWGFVGW